MSPIVLIGAGAVILLIGIGLGFWFGNAGRKRETAKTSEVQAELDTYRRDVSEHFSATAAHFQTIGEEYRRLYEHMAVGAQALCDDNLSVEGVGFAPVELLAAAAGRDDIEVEPEQTADAAPPPADFIQAAAPEPEPTDGSDQVVEASESESRDEEVTQPENEPAAAADMPEELLAETGAAADESKPEKTYH